MSAKIHDASRLESLLESAQLLNSSLDLDSLLKHLLRTVMGRTLAGRGLIAVATDGEMLIAQLRGLKNFKAGDPFDEMRLRESGIANVYPIGDAESPTGFLALSKPPTGEISAEEIESLKALLGIAASSIANAQAHDKTQKFNFQLNEKVQELRALLDLVRGLTSTLEAAEVAQLLILTLTGRWAVGKYALFVQKEKHAPVARSKGIALPRFESYAGLVKDLPEAARVADLPAGELRTALEEHKAQLVFPIQPSESASGLLVLGGRFGKLPFTNADLEFGAGLVAQAGVAFENSWYVSETIERQKIEQEFELAARIQEGLFPEFLPRIEGYELAAKNRPALWCGGDYYDVLRIEKTSEAGEKSFLLCVADISGKGMPASLLMSTLQATLRALAGSAKTLAELAMQTNALLHATTPSNKFATAILFEIFPASGKAVYVSAGHGDCLLMRENGEVENFDSTGLPLGMMDSTMLEMLGKNYEEKHIAIQPGDLLALYSDGVSEAYDIDENEWGLERLVECLRPNLKNSAEQIVGEVFRAIDDFAQTAPQHDDITLMIFKRLSER